MVVVVGIGGGVDQVQILVDVGFGDGGAVHGREVLEPRGRGPVAASIGAGGAAPRCVAARHEGAGLARVEEGLPRAAPGVKLDVLLVDAVPRRVCQRRASARSASRPCARSGSGMPSSRSSVRGHAVSRAATSLPPEAVLARRDPACFGVGGGTLTRC